MTPVLHTYDGILRVPTAQALVDANPELGGMRIRSLALLGDSTNKEYPGGTTGWLEVVATALGATIVNASHSGRRLTVSGGYTDPTIMDDYLSDIQPLSPTSGQEKWLFIMAGANDNYATSPDVYYAALKEIFTLARIDGWKVGAVVPPDSDMLTHFSPAQGRQQWFDYQRMILSEPDLTDLQLRFDLVLPDASDNTYFDSGLHINTAGQNLLGAHALGRLFARQPVGQVGADQIAAAVQPHLTQLALSEYDYSVQEIDVYNDTDETLLAGGSVVLRNGEGGYGLKVASGEVDGSFSGLRASSFIVNADNGQFKWDETDETTIGFWIKMRVLLLGDSFARFTAGYAGLQHHGELADNGVGFEVRNGATLDVRLLTFDGTGIHRGAWMNMAGLTAFPRMQTFALFVKGGTATLWVRAKNLLWRVADSADTAPVTQAVFADAVRISCNRDSGQVGGGWTPGNAASDSTLYVHNKIVISRGFDSPLNRLLI